jgi:hypothetical protein
VLLDASVRRAAASCKAVHTSGPRTMPGAGSKGPVPELVLHSRSLHVLIQPASDLLKRLIETFDPDHAEQ